MTITSNTMTTLASSVAVLSVLRALAAGPPSSSAEALDVASKQAFLLQDLLTDSTNQIQVPLVTLIPDIVIEYIQDMPIPGTSFWGNGRWHIHICASDPTDFQSFTSLHQLKHIIDHPLRHATTALSDSDWEASADHFAVRLLTRAEHPIVVSGERRDASD